MKEDHDRRSGAGAEEAPPGGSNWNVVVTVRDRGYATARDQLGRLGVVGETDYYNVLTLEVDNPRALLERWGSLSTEQPDLDRCISRVMPVEVTFAYQSVAEFEARSKEAVTLRLAELAGKSFHVRIHRRGFKGRLSSQLEEQFLDHFIVDALRRQGSTGVVTFEDPDVVVAVETLGQRAGLSLWTRDDRQRYPCLRLD